MGMEGEGGCVAVVVVAMWHGNSWRFRVSFSNQISPKIWKISWKTFFCEEKLSKVLDTLCDDYDDVKLLYKGKKMVGEKWKKTASQAALQDMSKCEQ